MNPITIPKQLKSKSFGFVKLAPKSKKPIEKNWPKNPVSLSDITVWIKKSNNYGIIGGYGDLVVLDADSPEMYIFAFRNLPSTFTVKTPKKGYHFYFICPGINQKIKLRKNDNDHGEIISHGSQVAGPGSIHPDTNSAYAIANDIEITKVKSDLLLETLSEYIPRSSNIENKEFETLKDKYGQPYYKNKDGRVTSLNQSFWAALHQSEHIQLYEPKEKVFYRYTEKSGLYQIISEDKIKQEISAKILQVSKENQQFDLESKRTNINLSNIVSQLKGITEKSNAFNTQERKHIHLKNGVISFNKNREIDFIQFSPNFYSRNQSPISFDEKATCNRFLDELLYPAVHPEDVVLIQKFFGLSLLGRNLIQRLMILDGLGGRGKSQLSLILQYLVGIENVSQLRTNHLGERFEIFRFLKKSLLVGVDVPGNFLSSKSSHVIKGLVGGDLFDAEQKGGTASFPVQGNFCVLITSNSRLQVKLEGDVSAWKRRLLIVRFESPPPKKKIPDFAQKLIKEEGSGILNWSLLGLSKLYEDIKKYGDISLTNRQSHIVDALLAESDSLRFFLKESVETSSSSDLTTSEIEEAYAEYCPQKGWNPKPITVIRKELEGLMLELFHTAKSNSIQRNGKNSRGFRRVKLKRGNQNDT